jgi:hypothetical protein
MRIEWLCKNKIIVNTILKNEGRAEGRKRRRWEKTK